MIVSDEMIHCDCGMEFLFIEGYRQHFVSGQHEEELSRLRTKTLVKSVTREV